MKNKITSKVQATRWRISQFGARSFWTAATISAALALSTTIGQTQDESPPKRPVFDQPDVIVPNSKGGAPIELRAVFKKQPIQMLTTTAKGTKLLTEKTITSPTWDHGLTGKTYLVMPGEDLPITVKNDLDFEYSEEQLRDRHLIGNFDDDDTVKLIMKSMNITNLHTHGLHVSPKGFQDNVFLFARQKKTIPYFYEIPKIHAPGTHWYHPHHHGSTALQVSEGMVGMLIVGEPKGQNLTPVGWPVIDRHLIIEAVDAREISLVPPELTSAKSVEETSNKPLQAIRRLINVETGDDFNNLMKDLKREDRVADLVEGLQTFNQPPTFTVNGLVNPVDEEILPGSLVRLRIVNAGSRVIDYKSLFLQKHKIFLAATDGVNLPQLPVDASDPPEFVSYNSKNQLTLAPGNRADVYFIMKGPPKKGPPEYSLMGVGLDRSGKEFRQRLMTFKVANPTENDQAKLKNDPYEKQLQRFLLELDANLKRLQTIPDTAYAKDGYLHAFDMNAKPDAKRTMTFDATNLFTEDKMLTVNGRSYNTKGEDDKMEGPSDYLGKNKGDGGKSPSGKSPWPIRRGTVEQWTIKNTTPKMAGWRGHHPFHIHVNPFWVYDIVEEGKSVRETNPNDPRLNRWQDTIDLPPMVGNVPGSVTIRHRFDRFDGMFVLHCHILQHEDRGMMLNVLIVPEDLDGIEAQEYFEQQVKDNARLNKKINQ